MSVTEKLSYKSWSAISLILHNGLKKYKPKNSKLVQLNQEVHNDNKTGSIAVFRNKSSMSRDMGFVVTSEEALIENIETLTHWTPNTFNWLGYDNSRKHIKGHSERNLSQINAFVVDIDFKDALDRDRNLNLVNSSIVLDDHILPTLVLKTDKGYQIYYILDRPAFLSKHKNDSMPVLSAARKISENIKGTIMEKIPATDVGCNSFGIFRIPREDNIIFFEPELTYSFAGFLMWSKSVTQKSKEKRKSNLKVINSPHSQYRKQTDQAWFRIMLTKHNIKPGQGLGRHNTILTLALACYSSGKNQNDAFNLLDEFNSYLEDPLDVRDMQRCVRDAYSGNYKGASKLYIDELIDTWATPDEKRIVVQESNVQWYKWAKPRTERVYSHVSEWLNDVTELINKVSSGADKVIMSTRAIRDALDISPSTLNRVMKQAISSNKLIVKKGKGNQASQIATLEMVLRALYRKREAESIAWVNYLEAFLKLQNRQYIEEQSVFSDVEGIDDEVDRFGTNISTG